MYLQDNYIMGRILLFHFIVHCFVGTLLVGYLDEKA